MNLRLGIVVFPLLVCALAIASKAGTALPDLLDTPAVLSKLAVVQPMTGIGRAGSRLVAVGQRGIVVLSDDNGKRWRQAKVPVGSDLTAVYFATSAQGWAVGHDGVILHTADAGTTWKRQFDGRELGKALDAYADAIGAQPGGDPEKMAAIRQSATEGVGLSLLDVWFADVREGYAIGSFNLILHTENGGRQWRPVLAQMDNPQGLHLYAIRAIGDEVYIAGEQGLLLKLDRQTQRFVKVITPYAGTFFGVTGNRDVVVAYGLRGNAWRSRDAGRTWEQVQTGTEASITGGTTTQDGRIALATIGGVVLVSGDGGLTFRSLSVPKLLPYTALIGAGDRRLALASLQGVQML